jgi:hypothetical protein
MIGGMFGGLFRSKSFRTKFILVVGAGVILDLLLSGSVALWNVHRLGDDASAEIKHGLEKASKEYLEKNHVALGPHFVFGFFVFHKR